MDDVGVFSDLKAEHRAEIYDLLKDLDYEADDLKWDFLLDHADVFGIRDDGVLAAMGGNVVYDEVVALLVMIVVRRDFQRRGLGKLVTQECMRRAGSAQPFLFASEQGLPLYRDHFGFQTIEKSIVYFGESQANPPTDGVTKLRDEDWSKLLELDVRVKGYDRRALLEHLRDAGHNIWTYKIDEAISGYAFHFDDHHHSVIGPIVASDGAMAKAMISKISQTYSGTRKLKIQLSQASHDLTSWLEEIGLKRGLVSPLMTLDGSPLPGELYHREVGIAGYPFG